MLMMSLDYQEQDLESYRAVTVTDKASGIDIRFDTGDIVVDYYNAVQYCLEKTAGLGGYGWLRTSTLDHFLADHDQYTVYLADDNVFYLVRDNDPSFINEMVGHKLAAVAWLEIERMRAEFDQVWIDKQPDPTETETKAQAFHWYLTGWLDHKHSEEDS